MSRKVTQTGSIRYTPTNTTGNSNASISNPTNAYHGCNSGEYSTTSYAQITITRNTTGYVNYVLTPPSGSEIPSNATITSVSGRFVFRTSGNGMSNCSAQIYANTTAKGTSTTFSGTSVTVRNISGGSGWTVNDLANLRIRATGTRSNSGSSYIRAHGCDVTVEYSYDVYYYTITASCNQYGTVSPTSQEYIEGSDSTITMTPTVAGFAPTKVLDNGIDVTSSIVAHSSGAYYTYDLTGLAADHNIVVTFPNPVTYTISGTVASSLSVTPSLPQTIAEGEDFSLAITPSLPGTITVRDNNVVTETYIIDPDDISAVTYEIENVVADHTLNIQFTELAKYTISGTIVSGLTISPSLPQQKYKGTDIVFEITPTEGGTITVDDNGDITNYGIPRDNVHPVDYLITNISAAHTLTITFTPIQQYQITGTVDSHITISPSLPQSAYTGDDVIFTLTPSAGGTITVDDNGNITTYAIPRSDVHSVQYVIYAISVAHTLNISYEPPEQFTISGTVGSGVTCSPSLPQSVYTGDSLNFTLTPSGAGVIRVNDNGTDAAVYEIPLDDISSVIYSLPTISESHVLAITYESLPQYTISATEVASELSISPSLPRTKYLGESQTFTITPNTSGQITIIDNGQETAVHYITPENIHSVTYSLTNISTNHELELKFSALPQFTATATLTGTGSLSPSSKTEYAGREVTFTITGVPSSNIIIARNNGENVSKQVTHSGTTYTYTFTLINNCTIQFTSKVPGSVVVNAYIDQNGTISPTTTTVTEGDEYTLQITPNDYSTKPFSVSDNCVEVVDELEARKDTATTTFTAASQTNSGISSGATNITNAVGYSAENPYNTTANAYASNGSTGYCNYTFNFSSIPSNATIISVGCKVYGRAENATYTEGSRECSLQMYKNGVAVGTKDHFTSTTKGILTMSNCGTGTRSELNNLSLRCTVAYYGGQVGGISLTIEYEIDQTRYYYTTTIYEATEIYVKYKPDFYIKVARQGIGLTLTALRPKIDGVRKLVKGLYVKINDEGMSVD